MKDRIMPFVSIQGVSVGGLKTKDALTKLKTYYPDDRSFVFTSGNKGMGVSAKKIDAKVNLDAAIAKAYAVGRGGSWNKSIKLTSTMDKDKLQSELTDVLSLNALNAKDANYSLTEGGSLNINPEEPSTSLNIASTSQLLESQLVAARPDSSIPIVLKQDLPNIKAADLQTMKDQVQQYLDQPSSILINGRTYAPTNDQKLSFIKVEIVNEKPVISINDDNVKTYIESISKKVTVASKPDVYFSNGSLSKTGVTGVSLDSDSAFTKYKQAILDHQSTPLALTTTTIPPKKSVIDAPYELNRYEGKYIEVDLSSQNLYQIEGDTLIGTHRISSGKRSTPTPVGTYSINFKTPRAFSAMYKLYMPYWMAFIGTKYGIHELPEWPGGKKEGQGHLGTPVSDGCIRLGIGEAKQVYDWTEIGTKVVIHR